MAHANQHSPVAGSWQRALAEAVRDPLELARLLEIPADELAAVAPADAAFGLIVPRSFVARMRKRDLRDPLLLQVLPQIREDTRVEGFVSDPLAEHALARSGVVRKYAGRALVVTTEACPVHCRYCFRRSFPYREQRAAREDWSACIDELGSGEPVREVILSGGDPLSLSNAKLARLLEALDSLPDLRTIRIHTRFPIMLPERIDAGLKSLLHSTGRNLVIVVHANHANEIDTDVAAGLRELAGIAHAMLNQSVLLKGVNDDAAALRALSERLLDSRVTPYYLHQLDAVDGAAHFAVEDARALDIVAEMRAAMPGYLVPKLVREIPNALSKIAID